MSTSISQQDLDDKTTSNPRLEQSSTDCANGGATELKPSTFRDYLASDASDDATRRSVVTWLLAQDSGLDLEGLDMENRLPGLAGWCEALWNLQGEWDSIQTERSHRWRRANGHCFYEWVSLIPCEEFEPEDLRGHWVQMFGAFYPSDWMYDEWTNEQTAPGFDTWEDTATTLAHLSADDLATIRLLWGQWEAEGGPARQAAFEAETVAMIARGELPDYRHAGMAASGEIVL